MVRSYRWIRRLDRDVTSAVSMATAPTTVVAKPRLPRITLSARVVASIGHYNIAYFPWPRQVVPPAQPPALVGTFHDFNHRHGFGNYCEQDVELLDAEMSEWLGGRVQPICSTPFIARELDEYYPERTNDPAVVYLSTFAIHEPSAEDVAKVMADFGLPEGYVLCPTNIGPHKNLISLLRAAGAMKRAGHPVKLVVTGSGTQCIGVDPTGDPLYSLTFVEPIDALNDALVQGDLIPGQDIWPLGYVSDAQMDALVRGAALVVAPSRYEAGSGPALDAWRLGTGVVSSALESVVQQMEFLGTEAILFDATDVDEMVGALTSALMHSGTAEAMVERSQRAMTRYTWTDVAREYVAVFRDAIDSSARFEALREQVSTRLRDRVVRDPEMLLAVCSLDPGFVADMQLISREPRTLRGTIRSIPVLGPLIYGAYGYLRANGGQNDG